MMSIRTIRSTVLATLCALSAGLLLPSTPAFGRGPTEIGSFSVGTGFFGGVGVEQSSQDVFVTGHSGVTGYRKKFSAEGNALLTEFNDSETPAKEMGELPTGVTVDESTSTSKGDVYLAEGSVSSAEHGLVYKFKPKTGEPSKYEYVCELTGPGGGCSKEGGTPTTPFSYSLGVAVDSEGTVYVGNSFGSSAVYEFDSEGNFLGALTGSNFANASAVAVGPGNTLYVTNFGGDTVKLTLNASHEMVSETVLDPHETSGVAVDRLTGNVYITDQEGGSHVVVYDSAGKLVEEFANKGELSEASAIAYSSQDGDIYVLDRASEHERIDVFAVVLLPEVEAKQASSVTAVGAKLSGKVIPEAPTAEWYFEYGETIAYGSSTPPVAITSTEEVSSVLGALNPGSVYHYRLVAINKNGAKTGTARSPDQMFMTPGSAEAQPATGVSQLAATVNATIDPGVLPTSYHFVYGPTGAYGSVSPIPDLYASSGQKDEQVSQTLTGLQPGVTYHYAIAINDAAGTYTSPDATFTTPPVPSPAVSTGGTNGITESLATLSGTIDPQGWNTTYHFQYGTTTAYGSIWPTVETDMGALTGTQPVVITVQNLQPGTTYHYRLVATNPGGSTYATDQTFTTSNYPVSVIQTAPVGAPLGITPAKTSKAKTKPKPKSKTHKHPTHKHPKSKKKHKHKRKK